MFSCRGGVELKTNITINDLTSRNIDNGIRNGHHNDHNGDNYEKNTTVDRKRHRGTNGGGLTKCVKHADWREKASRRQTCAQIRGACATPQNTDLPNKTGCYFSLYNTTCISVIYVYVYSKRLFPILLLSNRIRDVIYIKGLVSCQRDCIFVSL